MTRCKNMVLSHRCTKDMNPPRCTPLGQREDDCCNWLMLVSTVVKGKLDFPKDLIVMASRHILNTLQVIERSGHPRNPDV